MIEAFSPMSILFSLNTACFASYPFFVTIRTDVRITPHITPLKKRKASSLFSIKPSPHKPL